MDLKDYINLVKEYALTLTKHEVIVILIAVEAIFVFPFMICSFVVASTANAGFNCVLTGFLNASLAGGCYYVITKSKAPIAIGFLIGSTITILLLNLMTAIYWGQLSHCKPVKESLAGYSCANTTAYGAVAAFATLLFLVQIAFTVLLILWRDDFIDDTTNNSSANNTNRGTYAPISMSSIHTGSINQEGIKGTVAASFTGLPLSTDL